MKIAVQKFGGTSVATPELREKVVERIKETAGEGHRVVAVVSAMGRAGDPYATDTLKVLLENICADVPLRELDLMMSCGEIISAGVLVATLWKHGIPSRVMNGQQAGLVTDGVYSQAQVIDCRTDYLLHCLEKGEVPVVAGFQGATSEGEINTMGRGGSDTTAVILGAALDADRVDIFTDVSGIATADPNVFKDARFISRLSYNEVTQLAYEGARVIHPAAIEVAMKNNVTIAVRNLGDGGSGTIITGTGSGMGKNYGVDPKQIITGIAHIPGLAQFMVDFTASDADLELEMFEKLGEAGISIDLIGVFPLLKVFSVDGEMIGRTERILKKMNLHYSLKKECAKISVVGAGMRNIPGVMARIVKALRQQNIQILQTGDSNISICLLINGRDLVAAIKTLHDHFELQKENKIKTPFARVK